MSAEYAVTSEVVAAVAEIIECARSEWAPPGLPFLAAYPAIRQALAAAGVDLDGLTHLGESYDLTRPIQVGDVLSCAPSSVQRRGGTALGHVLLVCTDITDHDEQFVGSTRSTVLVRDGARWPQPATRLAQDSDSNRRPDKTFRVTADHVAAWAELSGDRHPVHLSHQAAKAIGLPGIIAHGSLLLALAARAATPEGVWVAATQTRFARPVPVPATLEITTSARGESRTEVTMHAHRQPVLRSTWSEFRGADHIPIPQGPAAARFRPISTSEPERW